MLYNCFQYIWCYFVECQRYEKNLITEIFGFGWFCLKVNIHIDICSNLSHHGENAGAKFAVPAQQRISLRRSYSQKKFFCNTQHQFCGNGQMNVWFLPLWYLFPCVPYGLPLLCSSLTISTTFETVSENPMSWCRWCPRRGLGVLTNGDWWPPRLKKQIVRKKE